MRHLSLVFILFLFSCNKGSDNDTQPQDKVDFSKLIGKTWKWGIRERYTQAYLQFFQGDSGLYKKIIFMNPPDIRYSHEPFTWHPVKPDTLLVDFGGSAIIKYPIVSLTDTVVTFHSGSSDFVYSTF
jgi:hypothetical protein